MQTSEYSAAGLAMTKSLEGLRLEAYQDSGQVWTIGYGHTGPEVHQGEQITEPEAEALLRADLAASVACVNGAVKVTLTQNQFDALVDFCFNVGCGNLKRSSLLADVNREQFEAAASQFGNWVFAGGQRVEGLVRRRQAEAAMFRG